MPNDINSEILRGNIRESARILNGSPDIERAEKQLSSAISAGTLPTYERAFEELKARRRSRIDIRNTSQDNSFYLQSFGFIREMSAGKNEAPPYGDIGRDTYLNNFWRKEPILAGAVYSMAAKMTSLNWQVSGKKNIALDYAKMFAAALYATDGSDWGGFVSSTAQDFYTTDRGVFWETPRIGNSVYGKLADLAHVDSLACTLTGNSKHPMIYHSDVTGQTIKFKAGEFIHFASMPSAREEYFGAGFCAVSRALRAAKLLMGLHDYDSEKLANLPPEGIAAITGLTKDEFKSAIELWRAERERNNSLTFPQVLWLVGSQPNAKVSIDFAGFSQIPESFDRNDVVTQYVNTLALDFGVDAREFWPISTSSLGTAAESEIQHMKAKGKGPGEFIALVERKLNGELPDDVDFGFDTQDMEEDLAAAAVAKAWVDAYMPLTTAGGAAEDIITKDDFLRLLADKNVLPDHMVHDDRIAVIDTDVHIDLHTKQFDDDACFMWTNGVLKQKRLPAITLNSRVRDIPLAKVVEKEKQESVIVAFDFANDDYVKGLQNTFDKSTIEVERHMTLLYLGKWGDNKKQELVSKLREFSRFQAPIEGEFTGYGVFNPSDSSDGKTPIVLLYDSPQLPFLRQALVTIFDTVRDAQGESIKNHGFIPHITLAYVDSFDKVLDSSELGRKQRKLDTISLWFGDDHYDFQLTGTEVYKEQKDDPPRNIKGKPIPEHEVIRGTQITETAIRDELELWRNTDALHEFSVSEDEQSKYIQEQVK